jgi:hypothetical protein
MEHHPTQEGEPGERHQPTGRGQQHPAGANEWSQRITVTETNADDRPSRDCTHQRSCPQRRGYSLIIQGIACSSPGLS